jgi:hypothetical protein
MSCGSACGTLDRRFQVRFPIILVVHTPGRAGSSGSRGDPLGLWDGGRCKGMKSRAKNQNIDELRDQDRVRCQHEQRGMPDAKEIAK